MKVGDKVICSRFKHNHPKEVWREVVAVRGKYVTVVEGATKDRYEIVSEHEARLNNKYGALGTALSVEEYQSRYRHKHLTGLLDLKKFTIQELEALLAVRGLPCPSKEETDSEALRQVGV